MEDLAQQLAKYEVGWWKAHHRRDEAGLIQNMANLYQLQFGLNYDDAVECVRYRVAAAKEHDMAEKLEDRGKQWEADFCWKKAEDLLKKHFEILTKYQTKT